MCDEWAKKDSRIIVLHKENSGVSSARNAALDIALGDYYIGFVDSDDYAEPNMYEFLLNKAIKYDADISRCTFAFYFENENKNVDAEINNNLMIFDNCDDALTDFFSSGYKSGVVWNKLYKRAVI